MSVRHAILLALAIRLLFFAVVLMRSSDQTVLYGGDSGEYVQLARTLASDGRFIISGDIATGGKYAPTRFASVEGAPEIVRTPGYPLLLAVAALLGNDDVVGVLLQIILSCLTVYMVYRIALLLFAKTQIAIVCALLYAIEPLSTLYSSKLLSETFFTTLITAFLYFMVRYVAGSSAWYLLFSALALAAAAYARPIIYYFPFVMTAVLLGLAFAWRGGRAKQIAAAAVFLLVSMLPVFLWQVRNTVEAGYHGFSAIEDVNWYFYQGASVLAGESGVSTPDMQVQMGYEDESTYFALHPEQRSWSQARIYEYMGREGRRIVTADPLRYAVVHLMGMLQTLRSPNDDEYASMLGLNTTDRGADQSAASPNSAQALTSLLTENPPLLLVILVSRAMLALYLLFGGAALLARRLYSRLVIPVLALGIYLLVMSGGPAAVSRFRHPIMPEICLLAGYGLYAAVAWVRTKADRRCAAASTVGTA